MLNIVIPMAGRGSRFAKVGYNLPKPLIPVHGVPMIKIVCNNLEPDCEHQFIFLCLKEHIVKYSIDQQLKDMEPDSKVVVVDRVTEGAACTVLLAQQYIDNNVPLMIANSDQWIDIDINDYLKAMENGNYAGFIMTMWADHPKWSYVGFGEDGTVNRVVEKEVISNDATVGIYNFARGNDFVSAAQEMIISNDRVNNEFYVAPSYNYLIKRGFKIGVYNIGKEYDGMYGMGIPSDLKLFEEMAVSRKAVELDKERVVYE